VIQYRWSTSISNDQRNNINISNKKTKEKKHEGKKEAHDPLETIYRNGDSSLPSSVKYRLLQVDQRSYDPFDPIKILTNSMRPAMRIDKASAYG